MPTLEDNIMEEGSSNNRIRLDPDLVRKAKLAKIDELIAERRLSHQKGQTPGVRRLEAVILGIASSLIAALIWAYFLKDLV